MALTKIELFDIIGLNETWLDILYKYLIAEVSIQGNKIFSVDKPTPFKRRGGSIMYVMNSLNPIERKSMATRTMGLIQVDINPKNTTHIKLVLVYRNIAADDDSSR